jgi:hypothetical protein
MSTTYVVFTRVAKIERRENVVYTNVLDRAKPRDPDNIVTVIEPRGWFVQLEGSRESICLGPDEPGFAAGAAVKMTIEVTE